MARYLMLDIGAGTLDMLVYDTDHDLHYKAVVRSPVRVLADEIRTLPGNLVVTGGEMGGGPVSQALIDRAKSAEVVMTAASAATLHHDLSRVAGHGIRVVEDKDAERLKTDSGFQHVRIGDLQPERLRKLVEAWAYPLRSMPWPFVPRIMAWRRPVFRTWISGINCLPRHWNVTHGPKP